MITKSPNMIGLLSVYVALANAFSPFFVFVLISASMTDFVTPACLYTNDSLSYPKLHATGWDFCMYSLQLKFM